MAQQRLQLKMKFLLGYTWKLLFCGGIKTWWWYFSWWSKIIQGSCWWWSFSEVNFAIKDSERNKLLGVYFHSSQPNWEICGNDFYVSYWEVETCNNLTLQLVIFCIFSHISFSVNKSYFHFKGESSISILHFNNVNFQTKQFLIFEKFLWNSV